MGSKLSITPPADYCLARDVCSYGYFVLAPNRWDVHRRVYERPLSLDNGVVRLTIAQPDAKPSKRATWGAELRIACDRALTRSEAARAKRLVTRMLNLDDDGVAEFHRADPRWKRSGRARLMRSPTFFEDLIKTVTSCNVSWPSTVNMNRRLCDVFAEAFPSAAQLARKRPSTLRARCGVGYRDARIVELAKMCARGEIGGAWFEDPSTSDDEVHRALLELPGVGPYAAANVMQLLRRYARLPIDTETMRHARSVLGMRGTESQLRKKIEAHYERFGDHRFRSYWFEMWADYERRRGKSWTWERESTGASFTASKLKD